MELFAQGFVQSTKVTESTALGYSARWIEKEMILRLS